MPFIIIFIFVPLIELMVFASVSEHIGIFTTLSLALFTAILGGAIVKHQGMQTILAIRSSIQSGQMPLSELFDGFCLVAAGALLITPGFVTDTIGFLLLVPIVRNLLRNFIKNHTNWSVNTAEFHSSTIRDPNIIEGEFENLNNNNDKDNN